MDIIREQYDMDRLKAHQAQHHSIHVPDEIIDNKTPEHMKIGTHRESQSAHSSFHSRPSPPIKKSCLQIKGPYSNSHNRYATQFLTPPNTIRCKAKVRYDSI